MKQVKNIQIFVEGRVQGVGYRRFVYQKAMVLGLKGWVRNLLDGRVEVQATFPSEVAQDQAELFLADLRRGPAFSKVKELKIIPLEKDLLENGFEIRPDEELESK